MLKDHLLPLCTSFCWPWLWNVGKQVSSMKGDVCPWSSSMGWARGRVQAPSLPLCSSWAVRGAGLRAVRYVAAVSHSVASDSFATPWTVLSTRLLYRWGFSRQQYWSGLPFPSPGYHLEPRDQTHISHLRGGFFTAKPPGKPH